MGLHYLGTLGGSRGGGVPTLNRVDACFACEATAFQEFGARQMHRSCSKGLGCEGCLVKPRGPKFSLIRYLGFGKDKP